MKDAKEYVQILADLQIHDLKLSGAFERLAEEQEATYDFAQRNQSVDHQHCEECGTKPVVRLGEADTALDIAYRCDLFVLGSGRPVLIDAQTKRDRIMLKKLHACS